MSYKHRVEANKLVGKTVISIDGNKNSDQLTFHFDDGSHAVMFHSQDCCESVSIEDIAGDLKDLIGSPLLQVEEVTSNEPDETEKARRAKEKADYELANPNGYYYDSYESETWTFYKLATIKGYVTIRWYGTSNGYYSETIDIELMPPGEKQSEY
jgi:hypothetical protein